MTAYENMNLRQLAEAIRTRHISANEALDAHLERIDAVNPTINAVVTLDEEGARKRADIADALIAKSSADRATLPPLLGVPMTHKDSIATKGIRTTSGSPIFRNHVPDQNALIIDRLQAAGVNSSGKTNVPEFAAGSHTFNPLFGTTYNPYDLSKSAGGSSGGVAAAVAAGIQPAGDGSDTGGSLRTPASFCNVVGYRPSLGRLPILPAKNPWSWLSRHGFIAREVPDIRFLMRIVAGPAAGSPSSLPRDSSYASVGRQDLKGLRIAWTENFGLEVPVETEVLRVLRGSIKAFQDLGADVETCAPDLRDADEVFQTTRAFDFAAQYGHLLDSHRHEIKAAMQWNVDKGLALDTRDIISVNEARARLMKSTQSFFEKYDVLIAPAVQVLPFAAEIEFPTVVNGVSTPNYLDWMRASTIISATGLPCLSVPAGFSKSGLPVGLQIITAEHNDGLLLDVAETFEQHTRAGLVKPEIIIRQDPEISSAKD